MVLITHSMWKMLRAINLVSPMPVSVLYRRINGAYSQVHPYMKRMAGEGLIKMEMLKNHKNKKGIRPIRIRKSVVFAVTLTQQGQVFRERLPFVPYGQKVHLCEDCGGHTFYYDSMAVVKCVCEHCVKSKSLKGSSVHLLDGGKGGQVEVV